MKFFRLSLSLVLCSVFAIGCVTMEEGTPDDINVESVIIENGFDTNSAWATEDIAESEATAQSCFQAWTCRPCPNGIRNVLVEFCDDGSQRIITAGPCGQPCF